MQIFTVVQIEQIEHFVDWHTSNILGLKLSQEWMEKWQMKFSLQESHNYEPLVNIENVVWTQY